MVPAGRVGRVYFVALIVSVIAGCFARAFLVQGVRIASGSMQDALLVGDHVLVNRFVFGQATGSSAPVLAAREVRRGDLLLFRYPEAPATLLVKRCLGLPGERVEWLEGRLRVDGVAVDESAYARGAGPRNLPPVVVPADSYYVLGDHRDASLDSRHWGVVPRDLVLGRPFLVYWSWDTALSPDATPGERFGEVTRRFFTGTRWERSGQLAR